MPSLLQKLSYYDPETGGTFVIAGDSFLWKEGKKDPQDSKVTKLVTRYGWKLRRGDDIWLDFEQRGNRGKLTVIRGSKMWTYSVPQRGGLLNRKLVADGEGLDSLYDALEKGMLTEAYAKAAACPAAIAVNNAGDGHDSVDGDPLPEIHILGSKLLQARQPMHDDSGALTGLRSRPDYGESDSYTSEMNEANSKSACIVLSGGVKTASGTEQAEMFIASVEYERGSALKLAGFKYSPDPALAKVFGRRTAENLVKQIRAFGAVAKLAKPNNLLTTQNIKTQKKPNKNLLTQHNLKTQKGETKGFLTGVMHMMPSDLAGYGNVCPCASPECRQMCLNTAGVWANAPAVQNARRMKTELYFKNRPQFMADMRKSIQSLVRKAEKENLTPAVRINGTSDLPQVAVEMAKEFPEVQFYDYTKIPKPWLRQLPNYHITFSRSEINDKETMEALEHGVNVAVVFSVAKGEPMPKEWRGYPVLNGDEHDLRFLDKLEGEGPFVIGLSGKGKAKGKNKGTESGFVVDPKSLVQIGPSITPAPKKEEPKEEKSPVSTTEERIKERTRPATEPEGEPEFWEEEAVTASAEENRPRNQWFIEGCFDDAHLYV
jgi:hypothetical protein